MIKVLIIDDHPIVRQGISQILSELDMVVETTGAGTVEEGLKRFLKEKFDVVLLDISLPGRSGLDAIKDFKTIGSSVPILMLSMFPEEQYAIRALRSGASGYLTKDSAPDELVAAVKKVLNGGKYITLSLAEKIFDGLSGSGEPTRKLSDREHEVLLGIARGKSIRKIAADLHLHEKTVSTYRARILEKLRLSTNADIIRYAIREGLVN
ncbi:MAG TPA: response regulator transcription factor [Bacteroidetes bacterium]|nr:response regulator transcription factor [Bacteroidota bacterium]